MSKSQARKQAARAVVERLARQRRRRRQAWTSAGAVLLLVIAGLIGYSVYTAQQPTEGFRAPSAATVDRSGIRVGEGAVTVDIYLDYLCPACRAFENDASETIRRHLAERRITVVYHPVAILDRYSTNRYSTRSAAGAGCAADSGRLTEYTSALYERQPAEGGPGHTDHDLVELAVEAGIPRQPFGECLRDGRYLDWVTHVTAEMARRGVNGTPTVFVNGQKLVQPTAQTLTAAIGTG